MTEIEFLFNQANKVEGLAFAGFETFRGSPYKSCARETGQNSRDASIGKGPVKVSFNLLKLERADIPFADRLQHAIECCLQSPHDEKTRQHLERAHEQITSPVIKVLEISDTNTTGLTGPTDDPGSVFAALVKGDGVTNKSDPTSAGSYGIGKNAAYAVSDLQTVIYSTRYIDKASGHAKFAAQGRLRLISHVDGGQKFSAEGYWGNAGFNAIEDEEEVPTWVTRADVGASIFSVGFREHDDWIERMALSLATNFFLAIDRKEIEFSVGDGQFKLNRSSLDGILHSAELEAIASDIDQVSDLERARRLLECIRSEVTGRHDICIPGLGNFTLHLLVGEGLPREVHILRNGIYITDNFVKFGQPMKSFPGTREFIAVLEPAQGPSGEAPSRLLKRLENPAHDEFEPERIVDPRELQTARSKIKALITEVRRIIRSVAKIDDMDHSQLEELSHLFAQGGADENYQGDDGERDPERFRYGDARRNGRSEPSGVSGEGRGSRGRGPETPIRPRTRTGSAGRNNERTAGTRHAIPLEAVRSIVSDPINGRERVIFFTPGADDDIELSIAAAGLSGDVALKIVHSDIGTVVNGRLRTSVRTRQRASIKVTFDEPFVGPIELAAVEVKK